MRLDRVDILEDCGTSLNPAIDRGQIEGGFIQGLGWLTMEEIVRDEAGRLLTDSLATYKIPLATSLPADFRVKIFTGRSSRDTAGLGAKAVGEPPVMLAISVYSAITQAIAALKPGAVPALDVPATPEAVMRAVRWIRDSTGA
jgi:xanthine dehydrogenase large subunit